jgi:CBS domain-containing protein
MLAKQLNLLRKALVFERCVQGLVPPVANMSAPLWVMTDDVCWCFEDGSVDEIEHEMARRQIRRLPDGRKRLVGMLTLGDLASRRA